MPKDRFTIRILVDDSEQAIDLPGSWATQEEAEVEAKAVVQAQARAAVVKNQEAEIVLTVCPHANPYGGFTEAEWSSLGIKLRDLDPYADPKNA